MGDFNSVRQPTNVCIRNFFICCTKQTHCKSYLHNSLEVPCCTLGGLAALKIFLVFGLLRANFRPLGLARQF